MPTRAKTVPNVKLSMPPEKWDLRGDPLDFLLTMCGANVVRNNKTLYKYIVVVMYMIAQGYGFICFVEVIIYYGWRKCFPYLTTILMVQSGLTIMLATAPFLTNMTSFGDNLTKCRSFTLGSRKVQKKILAESRLIKLYCMSNLILCLVTTTCFLPIFQDDTSFNPYYVTFIRYCGVPSKGVIIFLALIPLTICGYTTSWVATVTLYIAFQIKFQLYLLKDFVKYEIQYLSLRKQKNCEWILERNIKECARYYANLQSTTNAIFTAATFTFMFLSITGLLTFVSQVSFIFLNASPQNNWRMVLAILTCLAQFIPTCLAGQVLNDESDNYHYLLYCCPWYQWKIKTQKMLLIMLPNGLNSLGISSFGIIKLNKEYIVKSWNLSYSFITVARSFKDK